MCMTQGEAHFCYTLGPVGGREGIALKYLVSSIAAMNYIPWEGVRFEKGESY